MKIHLIGIGGIGMSSIAQMLIKLGHQVSGSDLNHNQNIFKLKELGAIVFEKHCCQNVVDKDLVVFSSAINSDNKEIRKAKMLNIPCISRAEMLNELMQNYNNICISGAHGKTTTTALCGELLKTAKFDPIVVNGGIINNFSSSIYFGNGKWGVIEADESDGSFLKVKPKVSIITNIDKEHLDYYETFDNLILAFKNFINMTSYFGITIACIDDINVREIISKINNRKIITYGKSEDAQIRAENIRLEKTGLKFDVCGLYKDLVLPMFGEHNVLNALAMVALSVYLKIPEVRLRESLKNFKGIDRRFTLRGEINGAKIIDDYAHHPKEILSVIKSSKQYGAKKIIAVLEPHRYSRLANLINDYACALESADHVILTPVYSASEENIYEISEKTLGNMIKKPVDYAQDETILQEIINKMARPGYVFLMMGAGNISKWSKNLFFDKAA